MRLIITGLIALVASPAAVSAAEFNATRSTSFSTGRYGGLETTDTFVTAYSMQADVNGWRLQMTLPQLQMSGGNGRAIVSGNVVPAAAAHRRSGDADMMLKIEHRLPMRQRLIDLSLGLQFKLPTGSRGLTTGSTDVTASVQASRRFGPVTPFVSVGYQRVGDMKGYALADGWTTSSGAMVTAGRTFLMVSYETSHAVVPGAPSRSLLAVAARPIGRGWSVSLYGSRGFTPGASKLMSGLALTRAFGR